MSSKRQQAQTVSERREVSKTRYKRVLSVVDHQTTQQQQQPGTTERVVLHVLAGQFGRYDPADVRKSIDAATRNGDLFRWEDSDGTPRLTCVAEADLRRVVQYLGERGDREQLARANQLLQEAV